MDMGLYDVIVLFVVVPFLLYIFTGIPQWLFKKAKKLTPKRLLIFFALVLLCFAVGIATLSDSVWNVRIFSLAVAALACLLHYVYTEKSDKEDAASGTDKDGNE